MKLNIPRVEAIVFELVEIDTQQAMSNSNYKPSVVKAVELAVLPEALNYRLRSRDALAQTEKNIYVQRFGLAPEHVTFTGSFGDDKRLVGTEWLDGWERLKQFEDEIFKKSKDINANKIYAVNYYDFLFQRFGVVNLESWSLSGNARNNANLINYTLEFTIVDKLYVVAPDLQLKNLTQALLNRTINLELSKNLSAKGLLIAGIDTIFEVAYGLEQVTDWIVGLAQKTILGKLILKKGAF